jgi:hypothetical protein
MREPELKAFLEERHSEASGFLDYKQTIYGEGKSKDEAHGEFLKDITGFANSQGGHIFIGVRDPTKLMQSEEVGEEIVGIENGDAVAQALESVAARWVDPRLTGFKVVPLLLEKGGHVLIVHIPPGESRSHRVNHDLSKNWTFFIRHGESIRMMTTQEIRDAALSTLTGEQQARAYAREVCEEQKDELISSEPVFLLQAAPLLRLDSAWDVTNGEFSNVMLGNNRRAEREDFYSPNRRSPPLRGIRAVDDKTNPTMILEVHRNGYVGVIFKIPPSNHKDDPHLYDTMIL